MNSARLWLALLLILLVLAPTYAQDALVSSPQPVSVGMSMQGNAFTLRAQVAAPTTLRVFCPITPGLIQFSGLTERVEAAYDQKQRLLSLTLPPGQYVVTIRALK
jgi:hypothetical protein